MPQIRDTTPGWVTGLQGASDTLAGAQRLTQERQRHEMQMQSAQQALEQHEIVFDQEQAQQQADAEAAGLRLDELDSYTQIESKSEEDWASDSRELYRTLNEGGVGPIAAFGIAGAANAPKAMERFERRKGRLAAVLPKMSPQAREMLLQRAEADAQEEVTREAQGRSLERWERAMRLGDLQTGSEMEDAQIQEASQEVMSELEAGNMDPDQASEALNDLRYRAASVRADIRKRETDLAAFDASYGSPEFLDTLSDIDRRNLIATREGLGNGSLTNNQAIGRAFQIRQPEAAKELKAKEVTPEERFAQAHQLVSKSGIPFNDMEEYMAAVEQTVQRLTPQGPQGPTPYIRSPGAGGGAPRTFGSREEALGGRQAGPQQTAVEAGMEAGIEPGPPRKWNEVPDAEKKSFIFQLIQGEWKDPSELGVDLDSLPEEVKQAVRDALKSGKAP